MNDALQKLDAKLGGDQRAVQAPRLNSFVEFLLQCGRVPTTDLSRAGESDPYTFEGREALIAICRVLDLILGSTTGVPLKDAILALAGGAQFGKTILELYLGAYISSQRFLNCGIYLPDDGLADAIVDQKFRPIVLDNLEWLARMTQVGRAVNKSGKSVNDKRAVLVTDGQRRSVVFFRGLKKVPTSLSADVVIRDEEDDIPRDKAKYLSGRLTASALRLQIIVGTQRIHGAGQNKVWENGSQGVMLIGPKSAATMPALPDDTVTDVPAGWITPEDHWPQVCRMQMGAAPSPNDPQLTHEGDFRRNGQVIAEHSPDARYYLADPATGAELDRHLVLWHHRRPERIKLRRWSFRIAQMGCAAIDLAQIVAHWTRAVSDSEEMVAFCCDRLAKPKSAAQALSPQILQRSRDVAPFQFSDRRAGVPRFGGLDTGDRCWLTIRETESPAVKRLIRADQIALGDVVRRMRDMFEAYELSALFIDERPAVSEARTLAMILNGLDKLAKFPRVDWTAKDSKFSTPDGLRWDGRNQRWINLRCAVVRFSKNQIGMGIEQGAAEFEDDGETKFVPLIKCNRFETIERVVTEFLTPAENVMETVTVNGKRQVRMEPAMRLPIRIAGAPGILETLDAHLLTGSQREKDDKTGELGDFVDKCDNHLLLANGYAGLAELVAGGIGRKRGSAAAIAATVGTEEDSMS